MRVFHAVSASFQAVDAADAVAAVPSLVHVPLEGVRGETIFPVTSPTFAPVSVYVHPFVGATYGRTVRSWNPVRALYAVAVVPRFPVITVVSPVFVTP